MKYLLIKNILIAHIKRIFLLLISIHFSLMLSYKITTPSEIEKEIINFSSETAHIKKKDGILHLSGDVKISYGPYIIQSDLVMAKTNSLSSPDVKIIEARKNIYFSNNKDITAKGDKLFMDLDKKYVSIEGNVEFSQGKSIIKAEKINVDLVTETVDFEGIKDSFIKN